MFVIVAATDPRVDTYVAKAGAFARPILSHLRQVVHRGCPEVVESIKWGHISFVYHGRILAFMAAFKAHASFGFWHQEMRKVVARDGCDTRDGNGQMRRITTVRDLPDDRTLLRYIGTATQLQDRGAPARARPASRPKTPLRVPPDLALALKKDRRAAATWEDFSYSHRKEYLEWLREAKRDETRAKRLAVTLAWLAEGKSRHWKYAN